MALSKHIPEIERQSYTLYREKSVHTLARKHANLNLSAWSLLLLQPMQNKMKNNVNPYRSLQVMQVRLRRFNSSHDKNSHEHIKRWRHRLKNSRGPLGPFDY